MLLRDTRDGLVKIPLNLSPRAALAFAVAASFFLGNLNAFADQFGTSVATDWQNWAAFSQGGGVTGTVTDQSGGSYIKGNVGVWGSGNISLSGSAVIDGELYYRTSGTLKLSAKAKITGAAHHDSAGDAILQNSSNEAYQESIQLNLADSHNYTYSINGGPTQSGATSPLTTVNNQSVTITGSGRIILQLQNFVLDGHNTLTLHGLNPATVFVLNVSKQFSLSNQAQILLSGISASHVLFNVLGSGPDAAINGSAQFRGILLANNRNVALNGSSVSTGEVVANKVTISGNAQLIHASP
jgi:hypothetical protein